MTTKLKFLIGGLAALTLSLGAAAQQAPGMQGKPTADCSKARDPQRCEALQKAQDACKDKAGPDKRKCMTESMPPMDCSKARNPERCEGHQKARDACKDKTGREHRQCMRDNAPTKPKA